MNKTTMKFRHLVSLIVFTVLYSVPHLASAIVDPAAAASQNQALQDARAVKDLCCRCSTKQVDGFCVKTKTNVVGSCGELVNAGELQNAKASHEALFTDFACQERELVDGECEAMADYPSPTDKAQCIVAPVGIVDLPPLLDASLRPALPPTEYVKPSLNVQIGDLEFGAITEDAQGANIIVPFLAQYISAVYRYLVGIVAIIAIIMVMYGGFRYLIGSAAGDVKAGKQIIVDAIVGMLLLFSAVAILRTINPALVQPAILALPKVALEGIDQGDKATEKKGYSGVPPIATYDPLFQSYAACQGFNWKLLKGLAAIESGLDPRNQTGSYTGLFQFDRAGCRDNTKQYPTSLVDCTDDFDPETSTAAAATRIAGFLKSIHKACPDADAESTVRLMYTGHNNGPGVLSYVLSQKACQIDQQEAVVRRYGLVHPNTRYARLVSPDYAAEKWRYGSKYWDAVNSLGGLKDTGIDPTVSATCLANSGQRVIPRTYVSN